MAQLTGKEQVKEYIKSADRKAFDIYLSNEGSNSLPVYQAKCSSCGEAADQFDSWATIFDGNGTNTTEYRILIHNNESTVGEGGEKNVNARRKSMMQVTFSLNPGVKVAPAAPGQQQPGVVYIPQPQAAAPAAVNGSSNADWEARIAAALEKQQHQFQIKLMEMQQNAIMQQMSAQMEEMRNMMYDQMEDEEDEEAAAEEEALESKKIEAENKKWEMIINGSQKVIGEVKEILYDTVLKKSDKALQPGAHAAVAGPENGVIEKQAPAQNAYKIPVSNNIGELPAYFDIANCTDENKKREFYEDQKLKCQKAIQELFVGDAHLGDDLMLLVEMYKNDYEMFAKLIGKLRP